MQTPWNLHFSIQSVKENEFWTTFFCKGKGRLSAVFIIMRLVEAKILRKIFPFFFFQDDPLNHSNIENVGASKQFSKLFKQNIVKGTTDPRVEFISYQVLTYWSIFFRISKKASTSKSQPNITISTKLKLKILTNLAWPRFNFATLAKLQLHNFAWTSNSKSWSNVMFQHRIPSVSSCDFCGFVFITMVGNLLMIYLLSKFEIIAGCGSCACGLPPSRLSHGEHTRCLPILYLPS